MGFSKLDDQLSGSSLLVQGGLELVGFWAILLSMKDSEGRIYDSVPMLARICGVTKDRVVEMLAILESPDPDSRTPDNEGRRLAIEREPRFCLIVLNHFKYRAGDTTAAERMRRHRERVRDGVTVTDSQRNVTDVTPNTSVSVSVSVQEDVSKDDANHTQDPERPTLELEALRLSRVIGGYRYPDIPEQLRGTEHAAIVREFTSFMGKGGVVNPATIRSKERLQHAVLRMREEVERLSPPAQPRGETSLDRIKRIEREAEQ